MFGLDPFNRLAAVSEILLLLALAAFIGWLLGRLARAGRIRALRSAIAGKEDELEKCRISKGSGLRLSTTDTLVSTPSSVAPDEPAPERPQSFITADPLLPVYAHDDTPALITEEALPAGSPMTDLSQLGDTPVNDLTDGSLRLPSESVGATADLTGTGNSEQAVLNRIAARAGEINFDRIGRAVASEADDLKDIVGVGPFLERKLHSLGIYTFRQVANFTKEDTSKVNEIIEFVPGRIERDSWVRQAQDFYERKYGRKR